MTTLAAVLLLAAAQAMPAAPPGVGSWPALRARSLAAPPTPLPRAAAGGVAPQSPALADEVVVEIRFHGNHSLADGELLEALGLAVGDTVTAESLEAARLRLLESGLVDRVEIRRRYRSLTATDRVVLVVAVRETASVVDRFMFLPILTGTDEYGLTYGARFTFIDLLGAGERLSVPLSWGGERQAAVELDAELESGPFDRVAGSAGMLRRENPHFEIGDQRFQVQAAGSRRVGPLLLDVGTRWANVDFGDGGEPLLGAGAGVRLDTRQERNLPRDAVYVGVAWERLWILDGGPAFHRWTVDLRGFKAFLGRTVLAAQARYEGVDGRLPDFERPFLGGAATLRGHPTGGYLGDVRAIGSLEWRIPVTPPVQVGDVGVSLFWDTGAVYDHGTPLGDARFRHGVGAGAFLSAVGLGLKIDVATDLEGSVRVHFGTGFRF